MNSSFLPISVDLPTVELLERWGKKTATGKTAFDHAVESRQFAVMSFALSIIQSTFSKEENTIRVKQYFALMTDLLNSDVKPENMLFVLAYRHLESIGVEISRDSSQIEMKECYVEFLKQCLLRGASAQSIIKELGTKSIDGITIYARLIESATDATKTKLEWLKTQLASHTDHATQALFASFLNDVQADLSRFPDSLPDVCYKWIEGNPTTQFDLDMQQGEYSTLAFSAYVIQPQFTREQNIQRVSTYLGLMVELAGKAKMRNVMWALGSIGSVDNETIGSRLLDDIDNWNLTSLYLHLLKTCLLNGTSSEMVINELAFKNKGSTILARLVQRFSAETTFQDLLNEILKKANQNDASNLLTLLVEAGFKEKFIEYYKFVDKLIDKLKSADVDKIVDFLKGSDGSIGMHIVPFHTAYRWDYLRLLKKCLDKGASKEKIHVIVEGAPNRKFRSLLDYCRNGPMSDLYFLIQHDLLSDVALKSLAQSKLSIISHIKTLPPINEKIELKKILLSEGSVGKIMTAIPDNLVEMGSLNHFFLEALCHYVSLCNGDDAEDLFHFVCKLSKDDISKQSYLLLALLEKVALNKQPAIQQDAKRLLKYKINDGRRLGNVLEALDWARYRALKISLSLITEVQPEALEPIYTPFVHPVSPTSLAVPSAPYLETVQSQLYQPLTTIPVSPQENALYQSVQYTPVFVPLEMVPGYYYTYATPMVTVVNPLVEMTPVQPSPPPHNATASVRDFSLFTNPAQPQPAGQMTNLMNEIEDLPSVLPKKKQERKAVMH